HALYKRNRSLGSDFGFSTYNELQQLGVWQHAHQAKVLKYPLNKNFLSLQVLTLRNQLIFFVLGVFIFLKLMGMGNWLLSCF
ncbi:hypothetical protein PDK09_27460, partial [Bacillus cereus]|nr:hypothetical protein [Bacillus cereus]MDA1769664.1 hypothetical protein [Bacillus cereus]